jgi:hypothetical protein
METLGRRGGATKFPSFSGAPSVVAIFPQSEQRDHAHKWKYHNGSIWCVEDKNKPGHREAPTFNFFQKAIIPQIPVKCDTKIALTYLERLKRAVASQRWDHLSKVAGRHRGPRSPFLP